MWYVTILRRENHGHCKGTRKFCIGVSILQTWEQRGGTVIEKSA